ncbi:hypothetical protein K8Q93_00040 [Candidatus Parcubacteria bacterium]|nr:hypothetical protein [Candidatus Parcubacteria bacterium]
MKIFNQNSGKPLVAAAIASVLVFAPLAYAQDNNKDENKSKEKSSFQVRFSNFAHSIFSRDKNKTEENKDKEVSKENALDIRIAPNGEVIVRGARISAISGTTLTAVATLGNTSMTWTVLTDSTTHFVTKGDKNTALSGLKVGDSVSFSGKLATAAFSVNAKVVKDWSVTTTTPALERHVFEGKLTALSTTTLPTSLTFSAGSKIYTALVPQGTEILNALWATTTLNRFSAGDTIRVFGTLQSGSTSVIDTLIIRNASLR